MFDLLSHLVVPMFGIIGTGAALLASAVAGAGASMYSANKASQAAKDAAKASQVDINALDAKTREIAKQNALDSAALEQQLTPEVPALRKQSIEGVSNSLNPTATDQYAQSLLSGSLGQQLGNNNPTNIQAGTAISPLLQAAIAKAKANLSLGGKLDVDTANSVTRAALSKTGQNFQGLGLGRDVVARDLGLTSYGIGNERLAQAASLGQQESAMNQAQAGLGLQAAGLNMQANEGNNQLAFNNASNLLNKIQLLKSLSDSSFSRNLSAAQLGQSIAQPTVGLDPGSVASAVTGNAANASAALSNRANIYGAQGQNYANLAGNLAGYGMLNYMNGAGSGGIKLNPVKDNGLSYV